MAGMGDTDWSCDSGPGGPDMLAIVDPGMRATLAQAANGANGRLLGLVDWRSAAARLEQQGSVSLVLAEARGADDAEIAPILPLLDALARNGDARVVVTLSFEQIDLLTANLTAPGIDLLCTPSPAEHFAALCLAGTPGAAALQDVGREGEAARLRQLHEDVARIAETLARLTRGESQAPGVPGARVSEAGSAYRFAPATTGELLDIGPREIREAIRARRMRDQHFGNGLFEDPAWDMLLDLFAAELEHAQVSVSSLCIAAAVAPTTALRWISRMTDAGLFERRPDPFDRRRAYMALSPRASASMRAYFAAVRRIGAPIV